MGGTWLNPDPRLPALLWQVPFPEWIQQQLITANNLTSTITNSDLELLGAITHQEVLTMHTNLTSTSHTLFNDNMAVVH